MSQAEELLNNVSTDYVTTYATSEPHIVVNSDRTITVPNELKKIAVQFDHNVETVTFDCPRYSDNHDMSTMQVYINYMLADGTKDSYPADNVTVDETDDTIMHFDWTITRNVTPVKGNVSFLICIKNVDEEGNESNHWNSELNRDLSISEGLECTETVLADYPDVITQILTRLSKVEEGSASETMDALQELTDTLYPPSPNLLVIPDYSRTADNNKGVNVNISNNRLVLSGTSTDAITLNIPVTKFTLPADTYTISVRNLNSSNTNGVTIFLKDEKYTIIKGADNVSSSVNSALGSIYTIKTVTTSTDKTVAYISISISSGLEIDQSFNLQIEAGGLATAYKSPDEKVLGGDLSRQVGKLNDNVVLASDFHAIGDGVTDDTDALQRAIDYCSENYKMLKLDSGKTYLISKSLSWTDNSIYLDGNFAMIKANKNIGSILYIDCADINDVTTTKIWGERNFRQQVICNLILNCAGVVDCGVRIQKGVKTHCNNITVIDPVTYGCFVNQNGWENSLSNIHITRLLNSLGGTGLFVYGSDNTFSDVVVIGCQTGVVNIGADNHYTKVHPWTTTSALDNLKQSISFDCRWSYCTFSQCMGDSTNIIFKISNNARVMINNCANTWADDYVANRDIDTNTYLFYFDETHTNKGADVTVTSSYFKPVVSEVDETFKCYYSNLTESDAPMLIDRATSGWENQPVTIESTLKDTGVALNTALDSILALQESYIKGGVTE